MADVSVQNERINGWIPSSATNVILNWPERIKTQPHDDRDSCFLHFDSKGPCGMTVNNDIDDDSASRHGEYLLHPLAPRAMHAPRCPIHATLRSKSDQHVAVNMMSTNLSLPEVLWSPLWQRIALHHDACSRANRTLTHWRTQLRAVSIISVASVALELQRRDAWARGGRLSASH